VPTTESDAVFFFQVAVPKQFSRLVIVIRGGERFMWLAVAMKDLHEKRAYKRHANHVVRQQRRSVANSDLHV
jgi:hypothetical protein